MSVGRNNENLEHDGLLARVGDVPQRRIASHNFREHERLPPHPYTHTYIYIYIYIRKPTLRSSSHVEPLDSVVSVPSEQGAIISERTVPDLGVYPGT